MPDNNSDVLRIYRQLSPSHRTELSVWISLAFKAENSARRALGYKAGSSSLKTQEYFCEKPKKRRKK